MPEAQQAGIPETNTQNLKTLNAYLEISMKKRVEMLGGTEQSRVSDPEPKMILIFRCVDLKTIPDKFIEWRLNIQTVARMVIK